MTVEEIELSELSSDPANVRRHSERNIEAVVASLRRFGQQIPLVVDAANVVRVGNARLEAMRRLGWTTARIVRTELSGADLAAYAIADNRAGDPDVGSTFDHAALADVLSALRSEDESLVADAGYSPAELAELLGEQAGDDVQPPEEFQSFDESIPTNCKCPKCGFEWSNGQ